MPDWNHAANRAHAVARARETLHRGDRVRIGSGLASVVVSFERWSILAPGCFESRTWDAVHPADITAVNGRPMTFLPELEAA